MGRALPASPDHCLRGTRLPLGERAQRLHKAAGLVKCHLAAGTLLRGPPLGRCRSLLPLGGRVCASLSARPFFAARHRVMMQLMRLATHCRDTWVRRLRTPARIRIRPSLGDRFLMDYYPCPPPPPEGGAPLLPEARRPPRAPPSSVPLAVPQRSCPPGRAAAPGARCAWSTGPPRAPGAKAWGHQPLLPRRPRGARRPCGRPAVPGGNASVRARPLGPRPARPARGPGALLLARPGAPHFPSPPGRPSPSCPPVRSTAQGVGDPSPPGPRAREPQAPKAAQASQVTRGGLRV